MDNASSNPVILTVLAHPDDETFGLGGTLALYARKGVDVYLVCATRGEVGSMDPELMKGYSTVGEVREAELMCAAGDTGIKSGFTFWIIATRVCPAHPITCIPRHWQQLHWMKFQIRSQVISESLNPRWSLLSIPLVDTVTLIISPSIAPPWKRSGWLQTLDFRDPGGLPPYQPQRLFFQTMPKGFIRMAVLMVRLTGGNPRAYGQNKDIDLVSIANERFPVHAVINYQPFSEIRDRAAACHASQGGAEATKGIQGWLRKYFQSNEQYMQAYPVPKKKSRVKDLFQDVDTNK